MTEHFPDGKPVSAWFGSTEKLTDIPAGKPVFDVTKYGVKPGRPDLVQTEAIQHVIDLAADAGAVVRFPVGEYASGSLFFKPGTALHLDENATLYGSRDIADFALLPTRMEGGSHSPLKRFLSTAK